MVVGAGNFLSGVLKHNDNKASTKALSERSRVSDTSTSTYSTISSTRSNPGKSSLETNKDTKFLTPTVTSSVLRPFPRGLRPEQIHITVVESLSTEAKARGDDFALASKAAENLQGLINCSTSFSMYQEPAKLVFEIQVTAISTGSRYNRFWGNDVGFVRLGIDFFIYDQTQPVHPILKHGKIVYINPLREQSLRQRIARNSGEKYLMKVLPVVSRQLVAESGIDTSYATMTVL